MKTIGIWMSICATVLVANYLEGGHFASLFQRTPAILVFLPQILFLFFSLGPKESTAWLKRVVNGTSVRGDREIMRRLEGLSFCLGGMGMVLGLIHVMTNLSETEKLGAGLAVCFVSFFYALIVPMMLFALPHRPKLKVVRSAPRLVREPERMRAAGFVVVGVLTLLFASAMTLWAISGVVIP